MERNILLHFLSHQETNELLVALGASFILVCSISCMFNHCKYIVYECLINTLFFSTWAGNMCCLLGNRPVWSIWKWTTSWITSICPEPRLMTPICADPRLMTWHWRHISSAGSGTPDTGEPAGILLVVLTTSRTSRDFDYMWPWLYNNINWKVLQKIGMVREGNDKKMAKKPLWAMWP